MSASGPLSGRLRAVSRDRRQRCRSGKRRCGGRSGSGWLEAG